MERQFATWAWCDDLQKRLKSFVTRSKATLKTIKNNFLDKTQYTGDWSNDQKAGEGILSQLINGVYKGIYSGQWKNDERNGAGVNFYHEQDGEVGVYNFTYLRLELV